MQKKLFLLKKFNVLHLRLISNNAFVVPIQNDSFRNKKEKKFKYLPRPKKQQQLTLNKFMVTKNRIPKNMSLKFTSNPKKRKFFIKKKFDSRKKFKKKKNFNYVPLLKKLILKKKKFKHV